MSDARRTSGSWRSNIKYVWKGEAKVDEFGQHYESVFVVRPNTSFMLRQYDTVQLEAPDDSLPYVGTILRLYDNDGNKKTVDIEWFYLRDEILDFAPKNHKNQHIEEKEVFLAEGEVEIVDNVLGSVRNPCYIVYLSPQDSLVEANQNAMANCPFYQLYFCRYSFNASKKLTYPISAAWQQNKYIVDKWAELPDDLKSFIRYEMKLPCFKGLSAVVPKFKSPSPKAASKGSSGTGSSGSTSGASGDKVEVKKEKEPTPGAKSVSSSVAALAGPVKAVMTTTASTSASGSKKDNSAKPVTSSTNTASNTSISSNPSSKPSSTALHPATTTTNTTTTTNNTNNTTTNTTTTIDGITPEQIRQWDVVELAQRLMYQDVSSDSDSDVDPLVYVTKKVRPESEEIVEYWSELTDRRRKLYIRDARALKEKLDSGDSSVSGVSGVSAGGSTAVGSSAVSSSAVNNNSGAEQKAGSTASTSVKGRSNSTDNTSARPSRSNTIDSTTKASPVKSLPARSPPAPIAAPTATTSDRTEVSRSDDDDDKSTTSGSAFKDIDTAEYAALQAELAQPNARDEALAYRLFCYDVAQNESDSGSSEGDSTDEEADAARAVHMKKKLPKKTPAVLSEEEVAKRAVEKAKRREEELFRRWADVSYRKMVNYIRRAQRLGGYHAHLQRHGLTAPAHSAPLASSTSTASPVKVEKDAQKVEKELSEQDLPYANILASMDAGSEEFDLAFQWMCVDLANGVQNAGDASHKPEGSANAVMEGQFLRKEWSNLTDRKRGYYYERVRQLRDTYRPNSTSVPVKPAQSRRAASNTQTRDRRTLASSQKAQEVASSSESEASDSADEASEGDDQDNDTVEQNVPLNDDDTVNEEGISANLMHAIKSGLGRYEIALQLLAADLSSSDDSSSSEEEESTKNRRNSTGTMNTSSRGAKEDKPKDSFLVEMDKIVVKFSDISQRRKTAYMKRAMALQEQYGGATDELTGFSAGSSAKFRSSSNRSARADNSAISDSPMKYSNQASGERFERKPDGQRKRDRSGSDQDASSKHNNTARSSRSTFLSAGIVGEATKRRRHTTSGVELAKEMQREVVEVKKRIRLPPVPGRRPGRPPANAVAVKVEQERESSSEEVESESDEQNEDGEGEGESKPKNDWRAAKKQRLEAAAASRKAGREARYKLLAEKAAEAQAAVRSRPSRAKPETKLPVPSPPAKTREVRPPQHPVHALIPTMRPTSDEDSDSLESVDEDPSEAQKPQRGGRGKRTTRPAASGDENSDIEEFNYEETVQKRGRGSRSSRGEPSANKLRRLNHAAAVSSTSLASRASINNSLASGEESGSEDGSEDPEALRVTIPSRYTTRARGALGDKANIVGEFLHASPTAASRKGGAGTPARIGEDFQVEVLSIADYKLSASEHTRSIASMTTRGSSSGSSVYWNSSATGTDAEDPSSTEGEIAEYLSRAWEIIDRLKTEKLSEYFQSERESLLDGSEDKSSDTADVASGDGASKAVEAAKTVEAKKEVDVLNGTFVTIHKEAEELLLHNFSECNRRLERALGKVEEVIESHLVLWTAAEQLAITQAFEKFGMNRRVLRNAVPEKTSDEAWDYTLRFLASAVELEDNTDKWDADHQENGGSSSSGESGSASGGSAGGGGVVKGNDEDIKARGADFIARLSASIDETSFWQFLFVLSSALKTGECSPAQLVVKLHYVLNMAQYLPVVKGGASVDVVQKPVVVKVESAVTVVTQDTSASPAVGSSIGAETVLRAPLDFTTSASSQDSGVLGSGLSGAGAVVSDLTVEGDRVDSSDAANFSGGAGDSTGEMVGELKVEKVEAAEETMEMAVEVVEVSVPVVEAPIQPFGSKLEAIRGFNLFLPVMVGRM